MSETVADTLAPTPLTMEDMHRLIGALYLEIEYLRRHVAQLRAHLEGNGAAPA